MLKDAYGNGLSTTSADARDAYDLGVRRFLGAEPGVEAAFNAAIEADADFALAHIGLARELQLRAERDRVNACIARADELSAGLTLERGITYPHIEIAADRQGSRCQTPCV